MTPDGDHEPRAILDDAGEVIAVAHVSREFDAEDAHHLATIIEAAKRHHEAQPGRDEMDAQQAVMRERIRARNQRLRSKEDGSHGPTTG